MNIETLISSGFEILSDSEASLITGGTNQTGTVITRVDERGQIIIKTYKPDGTLDSIVNTSTPLTPSLVTPTPPLITPAPPLTPSLLAS
ncbi:hypothetical protein [Nostoc sp. WHI]|uniref:hypothetical protein n=1 Tax=Nostoc sp. WHI TaxID=2650611 RepID=UPI0018C6E48B|nr:hypothetical protein [Nostoc sp. WHI]MBG1268620.1 hypothetical protein [Nostoc sp. WHI]MBG1268650.1 hypothetical protein [Nostoc sp. WHI]